MLATPSSHSVAIRHSGHRGTAYHNPGLHFDFKCFTLRHFTLFLLHLTFMKHKITPLFYFTVSLIHCMTIGCILVTFVHFTSFNLILPHSASWYYFMSVVLCFISRGLYFICSILSYFTSLLHLTSFNLCFLHCTVFVLHSASFQLNVTPWCFMDFILHHVYFIRLHFASLCVAWPYNIHLDHL